MKHTTILTLATMTLLATALAGPAEGVLGAPSYDNATETTYRQVRWEDFRGKGRKPAGWNRWQKGSYAHIATKIEIGGFEVEERRDGDAWIATIPRARPYAVMNKDFSATMHGARNAYTLAHEQLHFDIAELVARRMAVELSTVEGRGAARDAAREDLDRRLREAWEAGLLELYALQSRYDGETANGRLKKKQKKWAKEVPEMFREATEALATHLDAESR